MKAVQKFKALVDHRRPTALSETLGKGIRTLHPLDDASSEPALRKSRSVDMHDRRMVEGALAAEGVHHDIDAPDTKTTHKAMTNRIDSAVTVIHVPHRSDSDDQPHHKGKRIHSEDLPDRPEPHSDSLGEKGHAHDPLNEQPRFFGIGSGGDNSLEVLQQDIVAESPTAAEFNIYDTAYQEEVERIRAAQGHKAMVYLTRRVDKKKEYKADENMINAPEDSEVVGAHAGFKDLLDRARKKHHEEPPEDQVGGTGHTFSEIASRAMENTKAVGKDISDRGGLALGNAMHMAMEKRKEMTEKREEK